MVIESIFYPNDTFTTGSPTKKPMAPASPRKVNGTMDYEAMPSPTKNIASPTKQRKVVVTF